jgi:hypothetical protein
MFKWILYILLFVSVCSIKAQTLADTVKTTTQTAEPTITQTVQPTSTDTTRVNTSATQTTSVQSTPTQTLTPVTVKPKKYKKLKDPRQKPNFKRDNKELITLYKDTFDRKKEIILQNKRYHIYNNYLSAGVGQCYNSGWQQVELCTSFDFNFHARKNYFQIGGNLVGPALWNNNCIQLHAGWGYRLERCNYMLAAYGGVSFSDGYYLQNDTVKVKMNSVGGYIALQAFYKFKFDYGVGVSTFFDVNAKQSLAGIKIELFFSGAYKGFKKRNYAKEDEKYQVP